MRFSCKDTPSFIHNSCPAPHYSCSGRWYAAGSCHAGPFIVLQKKSTILPAVRRLHKGGRVRAGRAERSIYQHHTTHNGAISCSSGRLKGGRLSCQPLAGAGRDACGIRRMEASGKKKKRMEASGKKKKRKMFGNSETC